MFINRRKQELNLKLVYYGPALSGKTTNLEFIHRRTTPQLRGELVSLKTREDRTIFFDYMQLELGQIAGLKPRFNLYTVPGQVYYGATRKLVLQGADGIVFVADSHPARMEANLVALRDMAVYMREIGMDPRKVPIVVQFNKRDLPNAVSEERLRTHLRLNSAIPYFMASAINGQGVFGTLKAAINAVVQQVQAQMTRPAERSYAPVTA